MQDTQGNYVQDLLSDNFEEEIVTANCKRYIPYLYANKTEDLINGRKFASWNV